MRTRARNRVVGIVAGQRLTAKNRDGRKRIKRLVQHEHARLLKDRDMWKSLCGRQEEEIRILQQRVVALRAQAGGDARP